MSHTGRLYEASTRRNDEVVKWDLAGTLPFTVQLDMVGLYGKRASLDNTMADGCRCEWENPAVWNKGFVFLAGDNGKARLEDRCLSKLRSIKRGDSMQAYEGEEVVEVTVWLNQEDLCNRVSECEKRSTGFSQTLPYVYLAPAVRAPGLWSVMSVSIQAGMNGDLVVADKLFPRKTLQQQ
jgi:hypothetical protein